MKLHIIELSESDIQLLLSHLDAPDILESQGRFYAEAQKLREFKATHQSSVDPVKQGDFDGNI